MNENSDEILENFKVVCDNLIKNIPFDKEGSIEEAITDITQIKETIITKQGEIERLTSEMIDKTNAINQLKNSNYNLSKKLDLQNAQIEKTEEDLQKETEQDNINSILFG